MKRLCPSPVRHWSSTRAKCCTRSIRPSSQPSSESRIQSRFFLSLHVFFTIEASSHLAYPASGITCRLTHTYCRCMTYFVQKSKQHRIQERGQTGTRESDRDTELPRLASL